MQQLPGWISEWYQLLAVQIVGLVTLAIGIWKWLTKPIRDENKKLKRAHFRLKKFVKDNSFQWRTWVATADRHKMETEHQIEKLETKIEKIEGTTDRTEQALGSGLTEVRDRLTSIETEVKVRLDESRNRRKEDLDDKR